jgi:hypothetical protein
LRRNLAPELVEAFPIEHVSGRSGHGLVAGVVAELTGLIADSLDMLADADCLCAQEPPHVV